MKGFRSGAVLLVAVLLQNLAEAYSKSGLLSRYSGAAAKTKENALKYLQPGKLLSHSSVGKHANLLEDINQEDEEFPQDFSEQQPIAPDSQDVQAPSSRNEQISVKETEQETEEGKKQETGKDLASLEGNNSSASKKTLRLQEEANHYCSNLTANKAKFMRMEGEKAVCYVKLISGEGKCIDSCGSIVPCFGKGEIVVDIGDAGTLKILENAEKLKQKYCKTDSVA